MKIFQVGMGWPNEQAGGLNRYFSDLLRALASNQVEIKGFVTGKSGGFSENGYEIIEYSAANASLFRRLQKLYQSLRNSSQKFRPELIVSHFALYGVTASWFAHRCKLPIVTHFHGPWALEGSVEKKNSFSIAVKKRLEKLAYRRTKKFIVLSQAFKKVLSEQYDISPEKIAVLPPGIDTQKFLLKKSTAEARDQLGWPRDAVVGVSVRRLMKRMGLDAAIHAIKILAEQGQPITYYIGGTGPEEANLRKIIAELGLQDQIFLLGRVADEKLPLIYQAADFTLVPTRDWEGFGLVVAESLSCGTPCFVSSNGGLPEVVQGLSNNLILPGIDPETMARHLNSLPSILKDLTPRKCREHVLNHFTWDRNIGKILDVYRSVTSLAE